MPRPASGPITILRKRNNKRVFITDDRLTRQEIREDNDEGRSMVING
jgi:hypothetical protein